jgi:hypothetical protein
VAPPFAAKRAFCFPLLSSGTPHGLSAGSCLPRGSLLLKTEAGSGHFDNSQNSSHLERI